MNRDGLLVYLRTLRSSAATAVVCWLAVFTISMPLHADPLDGRWEFDEERSWEYFLGLYPQYRDVEEVRSSWARSHDPNQYIVISKEEVQIFADGENLVRHFEVAHAAGNSMTVRWRWNAGQEYMYDTYFILEDSIFLYWPPCKPSHEHCANVRLYYRRPEPTD